MSEHSNSAEARDLAYHLHSFTHLESLAEDGPLVLESGDGIYVTDNHGKRYIEGISGLWNIVVGFGEQRIAEAAFAQMKKLPAYHTFFGRTASPVIDLAERLIELAPVAMKRVYFVNSGSEANDTAIKMLWMLNKGAGKPDKRKIISRKSAYHGTTVASCSLNGKPYINCFGLPLKEILYADCPHYWRDGLPGESEEDYAGRLADNLEALIQAEGADTIAGFIAEPVMGAGGALVPPKGYFEKIEAVLRRHDIAIISDEVVCGFGRTGSMWGCETYNFRPDIICTSKCLTAGYFPMGAVLMSPEIDAQLMQAAEALGEFPHGFTTAGHPVGAAIALKTLELISEPD
ncbi:MAG: aminotransferase class III-fold pyridoxal phosphate-dependent enzyme, partial [Rhodospirillaceae bacterium]|nr:aminotransferase class III-fold pyridoxal phosphate-dependent enzyme [Rhodospirillaceae bacterium]